MFSEIFGCFPVFCQKDILSQQIYYFFMLAGKINYKKLEIYELSHQFVLHIYKICSSFPVYESNNITSQLRRASTCLPLNISEGSGAGSFKVFLNYLTFCYRSSLEVESILRLCRDLNYVNEVSHKETIELLDKFIRKLYRYMQYLEEKIGERELKRSSYYRQQTYELKNNENK